MSEADFMQRIVQRIKMRLKMRVHTIKKKGNECQLNFARLR